MKKSQLYKDVVSGKTTLKDLYDNKIVFLHKDNITVEYVHFWNWNKKIKDNHPNLNDYEIRALTYNGQVICRGRVVTDEDKYNGYIRWYYPEHEDEELYKKIMEQINNN